jgi:hypothetical protein
MKKSSLLRVLCVVVACVALGWAPKSVFAQRGGGHGGGGGSHGGGGGFHGGSVGSFHSGGGSYASGGARYGGYYGRGYYGGHGGYYGHVGYWGHRGYSSYRYGYGYGWGFGLGFGWGWPYWYPYGYGYSPWGYGPSYYPYYYPYNAPYGYSYPYNGDDSPPPGPGPKSRDNAPVKPPGTSAPQSVPSTSARSASIAASMPTAPLYPIRGTTATASDYRPTHAREQLPPTRREVQDAIRVAREMPPYAFQRRIDSGRYSDFTPEERKLVNNVAQFQLAWEKP